MGCEIEKKVLFTEAEIKTAIEQVGKDVIAEFSGEALSHLVLIGIQKQGIPFAKRLQRVIKAETGTEVPLGTLDISMYRDDIGLRKSLPAIQETIIPFDLDEQIIILSDDVLYTGRTIRAALDALTDYGRPKLIRLATLVDRGLREFPIRADYAGLSCNITAENKVKVHFSEESSQKEDAIYEIKKST